MKHGRNVCKKKKNEFMGILKRGRHCDERLDDEQS